MKWLPILYFSLLPLVPVAAQAGDDPWRALQTATQASLQAHDFNALDSLGDELRRTEARFPGGDSKLRQFYEDVGSFDAMACDCDADKNKITFEQRKADIAA